MNLKRAIFYAVAIVLVTTLVGLLLPLITSGRTDAGREFVVVKMQMVSIATALSQFETTYGKYPTGKNPNLFQSLSASNPKQYKFLLPSRTNSSGEMLDPWGSPYEIEISSDTNFVVRSAGKNRVKGDKDDYVYVSSKRSFGQEP